MRHFEFRHFGVTALVVLLAGLFLASCQYPSAAQPPTGSTPTAAATPPATVVVVTTTPGPTADSSNWSGYVATQGTFSAVSGTWTVPKPTSTGSFGSGATWVGIGGVSSQDLIQAGVVETSNGVGAVHYKSWIETLPRPQQSVPLEVSPGDSITVSISEQGADQWLITMKNNTTGQSYQTTVQYTSTQSSAEWIEEAPSVRRGILPLEDFGTVQFSGCSTVVDGKSLTIAQAGAQPISMIGNNGNVIATPSALTPDGTGFTVSRSGSGAAS